MKKQLLLIMFACALSCVLHAQTYVQLKSDTSDVWVGQYQHPKNTLRARWVDSDSTLAIIGTDNTVFAAARKYNAYTDQNNTPFSTYAALKLWVLQYFFVDASANGGGGLDASLYTGWGAYQDTVFTSSSPFVLTAGSTEKTLPNRAHMTIETQKPIDVNTFYRASDSMITGRSGDGLNIYVEFIAVPDANTTFLQSSVDIGGVIGELYTSVFTFPNGANVPQRISYSFAGYTLNTWQANGAKVKVMSDGNCSIYGIRYVLTRTHKAR